MKVSSLPDLLVDQLKDLFSAESQLVKALPKIAKRVTSAALKEAIQEHLAETKNQVSRLEQIAEILDCKVSGKKCKAMEGLLKEGDEIIQSATDDQVLDAGIVAAAQRVEHYEMAAYGSARTMAEVLGHNDVVQLLQETLEEEKAADQKLTTIVEEEIYPSITNENSNDSENGEEVDEDEEEPVMSGKQQSSRNRR